ncbi:ATP-binding protein [Desulfococcaceae bacterium HSG8]|nr:ATP-binding protein [Desulfococcaceae bacterium HSG8]
MDNTKPRTNPIMLIIYIFLLLASGTIIAQGNQPRLAGPSEKKVYHEPGANGSPGQNYLINPAGKPLSETGPVRDSKPGYTLCPYWLIAVSASLFLIVVMCFIFLLLLIRNLKTAADKRNSEVTVINEELIKEIQERRRTEERNRALLSAIPDMMFLQNRDGTFLDYHARDDSAFYTLPEQFLGKTPRDIMPEELAKKNMETIEQVRKTEQIHIHEYALKLRDESRYYEARLVPCENENVLAIVRDVTEDRLREEELRKAKEAAEAASKAKSEFLSRMTHEFRTPMNIITGMTYLVSQSGLTSKQLDYMGNIQSASDTLLAIVEDILDFSRIETGDMKINSVNFYLDRILENLCEKMGRKAEEKGLEMRFDIDKTIPFSLVGDPACLGKIFTHLTDNAIKFTKAGEIVIKAGAYEADTPDRIRLKLSVSDTGIGIPPEKFSDLFDPFTQADGSSTREFGGTGLGLALCKKLADMMGGRIWADSTLAKGSTFYFTATFGRSPGKTRNSPLSSCISGHQKQEELSAFTDSFPDISPDILKTELNEMSLLLEEGDAEASEHIDILKQYLKNSGLDDQIEQLGNQINHYDFEDARKTLENIMGQLSVLSGQ